jgi:hypothetical protein
MGTRQDRMTIHSWDGVTVLDLGEMDIWDGADLSLLRDTLADLIDTRGCRSIGVSLEHVKYIPSGFFGMLSDWHDKGIKMFAYMPQENVANMLWFRRFFDEISDGCFKLLSEQKEDLVLQHQAEWGEEVEWDAEEQDAVSTVRGRLADSR